MEEEEGPYRGFLLVWKLARRDGGGSLVAIGFRDWTKQRCFVIDFEGRER
jgi:hypothetical protein